MSQTHDKLQMNNLPCSILPKKTPNIGMRTYRTSRLKLTKKATMAAELASPLCFVSCRLANWFWQTFQIFSSRTWNPLLKLIFRHFPVNHRHLCWSIGAFLSPFDMSGSMFNIPVKPWRNGLISFFSLWIPFSIGRSGLVMQLPFGLSLLSLGAPK